MRRLVLILILILALVTGQSVVWAQESATSSTSQVKPADNTLKLANQKFNDTYQKFLNSQTAANKKEFDKVAVDFAQILMQAQLDYINKQESYFYNLFTVIPDNLSENWLQTERQQVMGWQSELEQVTTYAAARNIVGDSLDNWQQVLNKIKQIRVWLVYDRLDVLIRAADTISIDLSREQIQSQSEASADQQEKWQQWEVLFNEYRAEISKLKNMLASSRGNFADLKKWGDFSATDEVWQSAKQAIAEIYNELKIMQVLQTQAIGDYYNIATNLILPPQ